MFVILRHSKFTRVTLVQWLMLDVGRRPHRLAGEEIASALGHSLEKWVQKIQQEPAKTTKALLRWQQSQAGPTPTTAFIYLSPISILYPSSIYHLLSMSIDLVPRSKCSKYFKKDRSHGTC